MKTLPVAAVMLGIGFAIGWIAKPAPDSNNGSGVHAGPSANAGAPGGSAAGDAPGEVSVRPTKSDRERKPADAPSEDTKQRAKEMADKMRTAMIDKQKKKFEQHIELLARDLNLTPQQKEELLRQLEERMRKIDGMLTGPMDMRLEENQERDLMKLVSTSDIEEQLSGSLTPEQRTALADFQTREQNRKIDAAALKSLSKFQGLFDLEEGQQDELYRVLSEDAASRLANQNPREVLGNLFTENMGFDMDPYDLGLQGVMAEAMEQGEGQTDQKLMARTFREAIDKRIEEKIERLKPVLNESQLERYRAELKDKGMGVYSNMLMGLED